MKSELTIDVADFSMTPGGRYRAEGEASGEEFYETVLVPALNEAEHVIVDLDNPEGFASSFLEEVFGGVARSLGESALVRVTPRALSRPHRAVRAMSYMLRALRATK